MSSRYVVVKVEGLDPYKEAEVFESELRQRAMAYVMEYGGRVIDKSESRQWTPEGGWTPICRKLTEKSS